MVSPAVGVRNGENPENAIVFTTVMISELHLNVPDNDWGIYLNIYINFTSIHFRHLSMQRVCHLSDFILTFWIFLIFNSVFMVYSLLQLAKFLKIYARVDRVNNALFFKALHITSVQLGNMIFTQKYFKPYLDHALIK